MHVGVTNKCFDPLSRFEIKVHEISREYDWCHSGIPGLKTDQTVRLAALEKASEQNDEILICQ